MFLWRNRRVVDEVMASYMGSERAEKEEPHPLDGPRVKHRTMDDVDALLSKLNKVKEDDGEDDYPYVVNRGSSRASELRPGLSRNSSMMARSPSMLRSAAGGSSISRRPAPQQQQRPISTGLGGLWPSIGAGGSNAGGTPTTSSGYPPSSASGQRGERGPGSVAGSVAQSVRAGNGASFAFRNEQLPVYVTAGGGRVISMKQVGAGMPGYVPKEQVASSLLRTQV